MGGVIALRDEILQAVGRRVGRVCETHRESRLIWWVSKTRPTLRLFNGRQILREDRLRGNRMKPGRARGFGGADVVRAFAEVQKVATLLAGNAS